jgi:peptidyl-prolyl cis-trans isomerase C
MILQPARLLVLLFATAALPVFAQNLAIVNGKPVPSSRADLMVKQMAAQGQQDSPQLREMIKEELIAREILIQEADKLGLGNTPEVKNQLELARQSIVLRALSADFLKKNPVKDAEIKAEYDKLKADHDKTKARDDGKEYLARHILVDNEADAKAIIAKLKSGAKFEDLAKQSKDPGSAANGGELDWATPSSYVEPFSAAMVGLQKGKITETPVKTDFGFHVIRLEDVRAAKAPAPEEKFPTLEEAKPRIAEMLQQKKLQAYQQDLRKKAKIQ